MLSFIVGSDVSLGMADRIAGTLQITRVDLESAAQLARAPSPAGRRYVFVGMGVGVDVEPGLIDVTDRITLYRIVCVYSRDRTDEQSLQLQMRSESERIKQSQVRACGGRCYRSMHRLIVYVSHSLIDSTTHIHIHTPPKKAFQMEDDGHTPFMLLVLDGTRFVQVRRNR